MAKNDKQILGILPTALFKSWNERFLIIQQKGFRSCTFPLDKNEKVPTHFSIPTLKQINHRITKIVNTVYDILLVIKGYQHKRTRNIVQNDSKHCRALWYRYV